MKLSEALIQQRNNPCLRQVLCSREAALDLMFSSFKLHFRADLWAPLCALHSPPSTEPQECSMNSNHHPVTAQPADKLDSNGKKGQEQVYSEAEQTEALACAFLS